MTIMEVLDKVKKLDICYSINNDSECENIGELFTLTLLPGKHPYSFSYFDF